MRIIVTIDKIEEDTAAVELPGGEIVDAPLALFPEACEGDVYFIKKDSEETRARRRRIEGKMDRLFEV
ncbi:MAG: DUF3006 domain-containing protein [Clostridia bacterium]|nr:DUF3006 domain-containing protein [Clostridia bacterium]